MSLGSKSKGKLADTKQSLAIQKSLREYQEYWKKANNDNLPAVIRVTPEQLKKLKVSSGFYFEGSTLELM
jgi:hypothetical protein